MFYFLKDILKFSCLHSPSWMFLKLFLFSWIFFLVIEFPSGLSRCLNLMLLKANLDIDPAQLKNPGHSTTDLLTAFLYNNEEGKSEWNIFQWTAPGLRLQQFFLLLLMEILVLELKKGFLDPSPVLTQSLLKSPFKRVFRIPREVSDFSSEMYRILETMTNSKMTSSKTTDISRSQF